MSGKSGGQPTTTTTVQKADPWAGQQPYLQDVFSQAQQQYYNQGTPQYFPGATSAPIDPATQQAQNYALGQAQGTLPQIGQNAVGAANFNLTQAPYAESNPYLQSAIQSAFRPTIQAFTDPGGDLARGRSQFIDSGQYGGTRHGLAEGVAYGRLGEALSGRAAEMAYGNYNDAMARQLQQQALLPTVQGAALAPATVGEAVGQQRESYAQQLINDAIARWNFEQNVDAAKLAQYQGLIQGSYGGEGTGTSTYPTAQPNRALGALGGAASGAALGTMVMPGWGTAIGAGAGALLSLFAS